MVCWSPLTCSIDNHCVINHDQRILSVCYHPTACYYMLWTIQLSCVSHYLLVSPFTFVINPPDVLSTVLSTTNTTSLMVLSTTNMSYRWCCPHEHHDSVVHHKPPVVDSIVYHEHKIVTVLSITNTSYRQYCPPWPWVISVVQMGSYLQCCPSWTQAIDSFVYHEHKVLSTTNMSYWRCCCSPQCEAWMASSKTNMRWGIDGVINYQHALSTVGICFWLSLSTCIADHQPCIIAHQAVLSTTNTTSACVLDQHSIDAQRVCFCPNNYVSDLSQQTCVLDP